ncbi:Protein of unknown function [Andreprevotia lacus DSM 23236]|jgi:hypothetical protein|uniref:DUF3224 domain-containing protein n=1 Tax=Andreprevotia lacus DSM 23236 TaxID=1121001 RepID=A0A1W1X525_9NEIS|nr:DUF3224 domain-containing protein [Andreprevotia lacus]SMC19054.1 Protein of unknown function [Andreprevotia lacus DSM 23236]
MPRITGQFDVTLVAQPHEEQVGDPAIGRRSIDKHFHGELDAHSLGQMLAAGGSVPGSAGYVAIEKVTGTLAGRQGSFVLQHNGTMNRGQPTLTIHVVPDSGSDALTGLTGNMAIRIEDGQHFYDFDYALPDSAQ